MAKDDLIVEIGADIADLEKGLDKAKRELGKLEEKGKKTGKGFTANMKKMKGGALALVAAIGAATVAIGAMTRSVVEDAKQQRLWANRLGLVKDEFSSLVAVAKRFGAETDDVGDAIKDLNERIADAASGNKTYEEALNMVGLASKNLINLPVEQQFLKVADAIGKLNNVGDQNFVTAELMADAGFRLLEVFRLGEKGIGDMRREIVKNNESISAMDFKKLEELDKAFMEASREIGIMSKELVVRLKPAIMGVITVVKDFNDVMRFFIHEDPGKPKVLNAIETVEARRKGLVNSMNAISSSMVKLFDKMKGEGMSADAARSHPLMIGWQNELERIASQLENVNGKIDEAKLNAEESSAKDTKDEGLTDEQQKLAEAIVESTRRRAELLEQQKLQEASIRAQADLEEITARQALQDQLNGIDKAAADANAKMWEANWMGKMRVTQQVMGNLSTLMASENRKMFEVGKAAATANAVIDTIGSAQKSFNAMAGIPIVGPALGAAAAGAAIAAGMARVQAIQSTTMGGGGGGGLGGGGGGGGVATPTQEIVQQSNFDITFAGEGAVPQSDVRGLIGQINEEIANGAQLGTINVR